MKIFTQKLRLLTLAAALFSMSASVMGQGVVFSENFDKFTKGGTGSGADGSNIAASLNDYTESPGWTGDMVYQAGGTAKMGSSSKLGWIETPAINLSANGGAFTLEFESMAWSGDAQELKILLNGVLIHTITDLPKADYILKKYTLSLTGGTANTKIKFEGKQASKARFFLENLKVISGQSSSPGLAVQSSVVFAPIAINTSATENINIKGSNLTGNLTVAVSGDAFSTTVTTVSQADATAGFDIPVKFAPTTRGAHSGTLTISGGGLESAVTVALSGNAGGDFVVSDFDVTNPVTAVSYDFEDITNNVNFAATGWANIAVKGDRVWQGKTFDNKETGNTDRYIQATAFSSTNPSSQEYDIWLLTPAINFSNLPAGAKFRFDQAVFGAVESTTFGVYHIAVNGGNVVKTKLTLDKTATENNVWVETTADISGITGVGFIAFNYNRVEGVTTAASYRIDNVKLGVPTSVKNPDAGNQSIYVQKGQIVVETQTNGAVIEVYNIAGQRVATQTADSARNVITLPQGQIYIVKIGQTIKKVAL